MRTVSFYSLSRVLQDRLTGSISEGFPPRPLAVVPGGPRSERVWLGVMGGGLLGVLVLYLVGYGSLGSGLSRHGPIALGLYVGFIATAVFGFVKSRRHLTEVKSLPIPRGIYLFPACVIDATSADLVVFATTEGQATGTAGGVSLAFPGKTFAFTQASGTQASGNLAEQLVVAQRETAEAVAQNDSAKLSTLDPLHEPRFSSPVGPRAPYKFSLPAWQKLGWAIALGVGLAFGLSLFFMRNATSDALLYSRAKKADTEDAYRAYLVHGKTHVREVELTLLPRAALKAASAKGSVEAVRAFRADFPKTDIEDEYAEALRAAMTAELGRAKATGKLGALRAFEKKYPDHGLGKDLAAAVHEVYTKELARVIAASPPAERAEIEPLYTQLFAALEKLGPTVEIRFRRKPAPKLTSADKAIVKTATWNGVVSYVSKYFDAAHHKVREDVVAKELTEKLVPLFDPELVTIVPSAAEPDTGKGDEPFPKVKVPTLFFVHGADWSGHTYTSRKPHVTMVGLNFSFDAVFVLPEDKRAYKTKLDLWKGITVPQLREPGDGPLEERLYEGMAKSAYGAFEKKLLDAFVVSGG